MKKLTSRNLKINNRDLLQYIPSTAIWLILLVACFVDYANSSKEICGIFQPFKVTPENARFLVGGPFPLHAEDCLHVRPDVVQELIAVQWALSYWNQNPKHAEYKLAMSAADTCSRENEDLSQAISFLQEAGFFSPKECRRTEALSKTPLGLILPTQHGLLHPLKEALKAINIPIVTYSTSTRLALNDAQVRNVFSTAPSLEQYLEAAVSILKETRNNLISIIYSDSKISSSSLEKIKIDFDTIGIKVKDDLPLTHPDLGFRMASSPSKIILTLLTKTELTELMNLRGGRDMLKLFISVPLHDEVFADDEAHALLEAPSESQIILIQRSAIPMPEFKNYFLDILRNNYQSYALMAAYMQQQFNCTLIGTPFMEDCKDVTVDEMARQFVQSPSVESAILATYAFGILASSVTSDKTDPCATSGDVCTSKSVQYLKSLTYTFGEFDPPTLNKYVMKFDDHGIVRSVLIKGLQIVHPPNADLVTNEILEYSTGGDSKPRVFSENFVWPNQQPVKSVCSLAKAECQPCPRTETLDAQTAALQKSGDIYLVGLFDMRTWNQRSKQCSPVVDPKSVTMPAAFVYVLETLKRKYPELKLLPNVEIGGLVIDTCRFSVNTVSAVLTTGRSCVRVAEGIGNNATLPPQHIVGYASGQTEHSYLVARQMFTTEGGVPKTLVGVSADLQAMGLFNELNLMPEYELQGKILLDFLLRNKWDYITVLLSQDDPESLKAYDVFRAQAEMAQICIAEVMRVDRDRTLKSIKASSKPTTKIAIAFTTADDAALFLKTQRTYTVDHQLIYIFVGKAHDFEISLHDDSPIWKDAAFGAVSIQPKQTVSDDFVTFLSTINPKLLPERWFISFWQEYFQCAVSADSVSKYKIACTGEEKLPVELFGRMTREAYFMLGLETLIFGLDGLYKKLCPAQQGLCEEFFDQYQQQLLTLTSKIPRIDKFAIYNYKPGGKTGGNFVEIGNWTQRDGFRFGEPLVWYNANKTANSTLPQSSCKLPLCRCQLNADFFMKPIIEDAGNPPVVVKSSSNEFQENVQQHFVSNGEQLWNTPIRKNIWKTQTWTYIFLVVISLLLLGAVAVLGLVVVKLFYRVIKGNQSLGICLLCGVIMLYVTAYFFIFDPDPTVCRLRYFAHSLSYSVCFGVMIAKASQLRNSETLGANGFISFWNYWLLLFFVVAVQIALNLQWILVKNPVTINFIQEDQILLIKCSWTSDEFLVSHVYNIILLVLAMFMAVMNRNIKRNYKETRWLLYTCAVSLPIWLLWMICYSLIPANFKDTVVVMELITCATVILCFMFGPKVYILLSYEPVLVEYPPNYKFGMVPPPPQAMTKSTTMMQHQQHQQQIDEATIYFDSDDLPPTCRKSPLSNGTVSTKSTSMSSASSTISSGDTSPIYQAVVRKKSRSKRTKVAASPTPENQQVMCGAQVVSTLASVSNLVSRGDPVLFEETSSNEVIH